MATSTADRRSSRLDRHAVVLVAVLSALAAVYVLNQERGVDWGDDFALYLHQAKALVDGHPSSVIGPNRYAIAHSSWSTFSPPLYPWGWPLLLAPLVAAVGLDYTVLKLLEVAALCVFLGCLWRLVAVRAGQLAAYVVLLPVALSPIYVAGTDTLLSDLPYCAFVGLTLVLLDRCRRLGILSGDRRLVGLGVLLAATFAIRREGIALVVAVALVQLPAVLRRRRPDRLELRRLATPYAVAAAATGVLQLALPTPLFAHYAGAGPGQITAHLGYWGDVTAESFGLKPAGAPITPGGNVLLTVLLALAATGLAARIVNAGWTDAPLIGYALPATAILLSTGFREPRYLYSLLPFLAYFAYQAVPTVVGAATSRPGALRVATAATLVAGLALANFDARALAHATSYHRRYRFTTDGPDTVAAKKMFAAVDRLTRPTDVVAFFRARALTFYTGRRALQLTVLDQIERRADYYVMVKNSTYSQLLLSDADASAARFSKVWQDSQYVLWRVPAR